MATLTSSLAIQASASLVNQLDLGESRGNLNKSYSLALANGILAGQADRVFHDTRTLGPSATEDLDLVGTTLIDPLGVAFSAVKIKGLIVVAAAANTNNVVVGAAAATGWFTLLNSTGTVTLRPGAAFAAFVGVADLAGYAAVGGASDLLKIANSAGSTSVTYDIIVIGCSA